MNATPLSSRRPGFRTPIQRQAATAMEALVVCLALGVWTAGYAVLNPPEPTRAPRHQSMSPHQA